MKVIATLAASSVLALAVLLPQNAFAATLKARDIPAGVVIEVKGEIVPGDLTRLKRMTRDRVLAGLVLDSPGGIVEEAIPFARFVHDRKLAVYVSEECHSVCALIFFAGVRRYATSAARIGVHSVANMRDREDGSSYRLTVAMARIAADYGVPMALVGKLVTTRPDDITLLDAQDLAALKVEDGDPFARTSAEASALPAEGKGR